MFTEETQKEKLQAVYTINTKKYILLWKDSIKITKRKGQKNKG